MTQRKTIRTYSEMMRYSSFEERFKYLKLNGAVARETFGVERYLNQNFYRSDLWKSIRNKVIIRDNGCDLAHVDHELNSGIVIHHLNPISIEDIIEMSDYVTNPEYLVCVSESTHRRIHYGNEDSIKNFTIADRKPNDTCPWKK